MPHPKGNVKLSGDLHLPDAESDLAVEEGRTGREALAHERTESGRRGGVMIRFDDERDHTARHGRGRARATQHQQIRRVRIRSDDHAAGIAFREVTILNRVF